MKGPVQKQKLTREVGSFFNFLMSNNESMPVVGKGATILLYSDRHCAEVLEVSKCGKKVVLEMYHTTPDPDKREPIEIGHQSWKHELSGNKFEVVYRYNSWYRKNEVIQLCEGLSFRELSEENQIHIYEGNMYPQKVVSGITELNINYSKINILFGVLNYHYDWTF
jgi:hypothetical protein